MPSTYETLQHSKSYHKQCPKHTTNLNIGLCEISSCELAICPWNCQNATSATHPKTQLATHLKTQNCKESAAWMLVPGHFWQHTSNDGNHLATHLKIQIQCPEPTPNYVLAAGNAPETTERTSNHIAGCPANTQLEWGSGKETLGEGKPPKNRVKGGKQQETRKLRANPDFGRAMIFKTKTHKNMVKKQKRTSAKQDRHQENEQHILTCERQDSQPRNEGEQRKMISFRMSSLQL